MNKSLTQSLFFENNRSILFFLFFVPFFIISCSKSIEGYREEGEGVTRSLIQELTLIHSYQDLRGAQARLEVLYNNLTDLMIASHELQEKEGYIEIPELSKINHDLSDKLREELNRIYRLEGGKELMEKFQDKALQRLDTYKKRIAKRKKI
jgi:hypothetical protein